MRLMPPPRALGVLALCGGLTAAGGLALAQVVFFQTLAGTETMTVALPGAGSSGFTTTGRVSNGRSYAYFTTFPTASFTIGAVPTGTTVSTAGIVTGGMLAFNVTNGTAITITMPPSASLLDGEILEICNLTATAWATNAVTVAANTGQSFVGTNIQTLTTLAASTCNKWFWNSAAATWFTAGNLVAM